jgi:hypothetical protein
MIMTEITPELLRFVPMLAELDEYFQRRGVAEWCFGPVQSRSPNVVPMEEGCDTTRKTELLHSRIQAVIDEEQFGDMTIAEIIGTLEIAKATHINRLFQE